MFDWLRSVVAIRLATSAKEWTTIFSDYAKESEKKKGKKVKKEESGHDPMPTLFQVFG